MSDTKGEKMISEETKQQLILSLLGLEEKSKSGNSFYKVGSDYVIRTVTMIYLGQVKSEDSETITLEDCAWIPDTSRWSGFLEGKKPNEMEPYQNDVLIYKGAILDATELTKKIKRELI